MITQAEAVDYLTKPVDTTRLVMSAPRTLELDDLKTENSSLREHLSAIGLSHPEAFAAIKTQSKTLLGIFHYVEALARTELPILIVGETGVGKELIARAVHEASGRPGKFVPVNVAGLDDTLFSDALFGHVRGAFTGADQDRAGLVQSASGGTLFLDEIGDMSRDSQTKLLRLLQEKEFYMLGSYKAQTTDARFVFATSTDLPTRIGQGLFRQDLYYRLQSHSVVITPLRERLCDIPLLFHHFLRRAASRMRKPVPPVSPEIIQLLMSCQFPGNVRELEGLAADAIVSCPAGTLTLEYFERKIGRLGDVAQRADHGCQESPDTFPLGQRPNEKLMTLKESEQKLIDEALRRSNGNKTQAAVMLGISRQALCNRIRRGRHKKLAHLFLG